MIESETCMRERERMHTVFKCNGCLNLDLTRNCLMLNYLKDDVIVTTPLLRSHGSVVAKLMCGSTNIEIERGRHKKIPRENRFCIFCQNMELEDELHFILKCPFYDDLRNPIFQLTNLQNTNFTDLTDLEQLGSSFDQRIC